MLDLKEYIIEKSQEIGIDIIGFTDSEPIIDLRDYLQYRIDNDLQTEFEERDLEKRINPRLTLPSCRTIILIGLSYNVDFKIERNKKLKGLLSKSSWGIDYHRVLADKIQELISQIQREVEFEYKYYVDTGPLIDRELAKKAGVGYYGKNCSIINEEYGSFIFLGYILTNLDVKASPISVDSQCGDCDLCIRACPTGALEGPYRLNPKKCLSYLTQTKAIMPENLREKMANKIYGCDTCQTVCPKNKQVKLSDHNEFIPKITQGVLDIEELFSMSNREFKVKYGHISGSWRGRNILRRNGIIILNNMKNNESKKLLSEIKNNHIICKEYDL